jgi:hypothetical protein
MKTVNDLVQNGWELVDCKRDQLTTNAFIEGLRDAIAPGRFQSPTMV